MAGMNMLCSDKTGTLTLNKMEIQEYCPIFSNLVKDYHEVVQYAAMAAKWKEVRSVVCGCLSYEAGWGRGSVN
jgi:H+-transporting ATPase